MQENKKLIQSLYNEIGDDVALLQNPEVAHLTINGNRVLGLQAVAGLHITPTEKEDGVNLTIKVDPYVKIEKPVHICFGMMHGKGLQKIGMDLEMGEGSSMAVLAHCVFPSGKKIIHKMDAVMKIGKNAHYSYLEKHVHGESGEIEVYPVSDIELGENARFTTEFSLIKGRVGRLAIDYKTRCAPHSVMEMTAKISGQQDDIISIRETGILEAYARGVLTTSIAVKDTAQAEVYNKLTALGEYVRGHVDCKEIIRDNAVAKATPIVEVRNPRAHITHEAAIGSVDKKQLETLMARGLDEEAASDIIIQGLLQ